MVSDVCGIIRKSGLGIQVAMKVAVTSNGVVVHHALLLVLLVVAPAYLIIVADAVSVNFSGRCKFLQI